MFGCLKKLKGNRIKHLVSRNSSRSILQNQLRNIYGYVKDSIWREHRIISFLMQKYIEIHYFLKDMNLFDNLCVSITEAKALAPEYS